MIDEGAISGKIAKTVFEEMVKSGEHPEKIVREKGLSQVSDEETLRKTIADLITAFPTERSRFQKGEVKLMGFFVGEVMKRTAGKANPAKVNELLKKALSPPTGGGE